MFHLPLWFWIALPSVTLVLYYMGQLGFGFRFWFTRDRDHRAAVRHAARIRRTWRHVATNLDGLNRPADGKSGKGKKASGPKLIPDLTKVTPTRFGVTLEFGTILGVGAEEFSKQATHLANHWRALRVIVPIDQPKSGRVIVRAVMREPLEAVLPSPLISKDGKLLCPPGSLSCNDDILLGYAEDGEPIVLNLAKSAHGAIQGKTRSGKSITVNTILAYASLMRDVRVIIIDPNLGAVAPWWRTAHTVSDMTDPAEAIEILRAVKREMYTRKKLFWKLRTDKITKFSEKTPLILLAIDEVSNYTNWSVSKVANEFKSELRALVSQGAKFGVRVLLLGQKLSHDVLDTATRTNVDTRICHKVDTLDDFKHLFPDATNLGVTAADRTMPQGVAIVSVLSHLDPVRMRSMYLPAEACWDISDAIVAAGGQVRPLPDFDYEDDESQAVLPTPDTDAMGEHGHPAVVGGGGDSAADDSVQPNKPRLRLAKTPPAEGRAVG